ncbi:phosphate ABC transporter permease [Salinarchaeum sp. Harcht-Bsk1]|uniref:phosphate ABC transporter permease PstA n=1 Tax=Salinarchaeum sp. Harcht-Bsk1 TaxID=1333523 RepID=UPI0003422990|nr:phosphate ABC transporter permease PstA [Salinarchaeum sp. Harcht-Bsk1]AGN00276.1 phosphate ABC transporter permease [Salinarchaeum sp. Harcht-Bsk1]
MATDHSTDFGHVSRLRGTLFEALSLGSSLLGIVTLGILLAIVSVDALGLDAADGGWILTIVGLVVVPPLALCTVGLDDAAVRVRAAAALVLGVPAAFAAELAFGAIGVNAALLEWQLLYLFTVVLPVAGVVLSAGTRSPVGSVAMGFLGRAIGGLVLGAAILILFVVVEPQLWFLLYTLGVLPFVAITVYARRHPDTRLGIARVPAAAVGAAAAIAIHQFLIFYTPYWVFHVWSLAIPAAVAVGLTYRSARPDASGVIAGGVTALALVFGSLGIGALGLPPSYALFVLLGLIPAGLYAERAVGSHPSRLGLAVPLVLIAGVALALGLVDVLSLAGPEPWLDWQFLTSVKGSPAEAAGFYPAIVGSVVVIALVALLSFAFGVGTAVFLEEYTADEGLVGSITRLVQVNIANLAAVPSVVYGLLGLAVFANMLGLGLGTIVTASLTLSLLILPITIISAQEAIRSVPDDLRRGSDAMGATRWQTTKNVVIPQALPGIFTGTILALGRAIGETAPLILIGAASSTTSAPSELFDTAIAMPLQLFAWYNNPGAFREGVVPAGVVTLLAILLVMNGTAIVLRNKYERADG